MSTLQERTEQALIGALLQEPERLADVRGVRIREFENIAHGAIFDAIQQLTQERGDLRGAELARRVADYVEIPSVTTEYLGNLALSSPDPTHAATYGRILIDASIQRTLTDFTSRLSEQIARAQIGAASEVLAPAARDARAELLADYPAGTTLEQIAAQHDSLRASAATFTYLHAEYPYHEPAPVGGWEREDVILADLLQHPHIVARVRDWLEPELFSDGPRRETYETILILDEYGDPVDELTVAWELSRRKTLSAVDQYGADHVREEGPTAAGPGYVGYLASAVVTPGVAAELGRDLLADHASTTLAAAALSELNGQNPRQLAVTGPQHSTGPEQTQLTPNLQPGLQQHAQADEIRYER